MSDVEWGKSQAAKAFNKFREGSIIRSDFIMEQGVLLLIESIKESLDREDIFSSLAGLSDFWNYVAGSEITSERLNSMPKEFRAVLSREKIINRQRVDIPSRLKPILQRLKEVVHVGELLYKRKVIEDKTNFISRSKDILNECAAELKQLQ